MKLLSMSGFVPEHICDTVRFRQFRGDRNIAHYCGYVSDFISQVIQDDSVDGAVFPKTCDSSRIITSYLSDTSKFIYQLRVPYRYGAGAVDFFTESIRDYSRCIEEKFKVNLDNMHRRCELINLRNKAVHDVYDNLENVSYYEYISMLHDMYEKPLEEQSVGLLNKKSTGGKRAFLIGSFLSNDRIAKSVEEKGFQVVGDYLPESGRLISAGEIDLEVKDLYCAVAENILSQNPSPSQNCFFESVKKIAEECSKKSVESIIYISQKYCEPYDYFYSILKQHIVNIPILHLTVCDTEDESKVDLMLEAFAASV